ncbi:hypothetical protein EXIGLDRAFT_767922 [Exidia glandulosa HHB12029]|uniref:Uncharacterized protein n=1 Tax=Exidia glandulosa HHB12029 TaxID=1314781 RepID=A0A165IMM4_EXIGL|nr:hypothetical protein EXIGLDRAFT_767922 [Exidia glandulosa HHB12029]
MAAPAPTPAPPSTTYKYPPEVVDLRTYADSISKKVIDLRSKRDSSTTQISAHALSIADAVENACAGRSSASNGHTTLAMPSITVESQAALIPRDTISITTTDALIAVDAQLDSLSLCRIARRLSIYYSLAHIVSYKTQLS